MSRLNTLTWICRHVTHFIHTDRHNTHLIVYIHSSIRIRTDGQVVVSNATLYLLKRKRHFPRNCSLGWLGWERMMSEDIFFRDRIQFIPLEFWVKERAIRIERHRSFRNSDRRWEEWALILSCSKRPDLISPPLSPSALQQSDLVPKRALGIC